MVRPERDRLSGSIQVDETYIYGGKPGKRGRGATGKTLVVIAAQEDGDATGRIRLKKVVDASAESLGGAVRETIEPGAVIKTDGWGSYNRLQSLGYKHDVIHKTADVGEDLLPLCHREAGLIKRWLTATHHGVVSHEHLAYYLDEYTVRFNRRTSSYRGKLFYRLLQNAVVLDPMRYDDMTMAVRGPGQKHKI
jgi:transposase-like protein